MAFNGIPNKFITTLRWLSGKYLERNVPIVGKYIPTHDSKRKRLSMRMDKTAPGVDTNMDRLLHDEMMGERIVLSTGRDVKVEMMPGVEELIEMVALPMATEASASIATAKFSVNIALLFPSLSNLASVDDANCPNKVDPRRQHAMKHENTVPYGVPISDEGSAANLEK